MQYQTGLNKRRNMIRQTIKKSEKSMKYYLNIKNIKLEKVQ